MHNQERPKGSSSPIISDVLDSICTHSIVDNSAGCIAVQTKEKISEFKRNGAHVVFMAGTFDILHLNHYIGLLVAKVLASIRILKLDSEKLSKADIERVMSFASSNAIKLVVTLDSNDSLHLNKSNDPNKGPSDRPILDWDSRALSLTSMCISNLSMTQTNRLVDYVTVHGKGGCKSCDACFSDNNMKLAAFSHPDYIVVNKASWQTLREAETLIKLNKITKDSLIVAEEKNNQIFDAILNNIIKSTNIIKKANGLI